MSHPRRTVRPMGDAALLVAASGPTEARRLAAVLDDAAVAAVHPGVVEAVVGLRSLLVHLEPGVADLERLSAWLASAEVGGPGGPTAPPQRTVELPVVFGGPDTDEVCRRSGIGAAELAGLMTAAPLVVAAIGFSPGFAYLEGLPPPLDAVPRRTRPRPSVPAGSVALGGGMAAIYPQATPGGWSLVGWSPAELFDALTPPYALLRPGDEVRLVPSAVRPSATQPLLTQSPVRPSPSSPPWRPPLRPRAGETASAVVEDPGILSLVQDTGRPGWAHLGVPAAGPADPLAHGLANRLAGNPPGAPAVEATGRGPALRALRPLHVAVVGGDARLSVDGLDVGTEHVVPVAAGQRLVLGPSRTGLRSYLAVAGGVLVPEVLGSRSTDLLAGLGPGPLAAGDELVVGERPGPLGDRLSGRARVGTTAAGAAHWEVRVLPGPHQEWFGAGALEELSSRPFVVDTATDRVGVRLVPAGAPVSRRPGDMSSQGMVRGAVQVPPDGSPLVLGPDHATLGGYPVVAVVVTADHWVLGQCRPGDTVSLVTVEPAEAAVALAAMRTLLAEAVVGTYPLTAG